jgi:lysophospholipase L1-like esterase
VACFACYVTVSLTAGQAFTRGTYAVCCEPGGGRGHWAVTQRRYRIAAVVAALVACCLAFSLWIVTGYRNARPSRAVSSVQLEPHQGRGAAAPGQPTMLSVATPLAACEARIEHETRRLPTVAIVGASYTAGTGPDNPELSWAVALARQLHWNAVIYGVPGAGYVRAGASGRGPMAHMLGKEGLHGLGPALVIVQAGHDDAGVPGGLEGRQVRAAVNLIHAAAPGARIALLTTFAVTPGGSPALRQADQAIVTAGTAADPGVIVMDPLAGRWTYPRAGDGLHPTAAGDAWIARTVAAILAAHGVRPAPATSTVPVICDLSVGAGKPVSATA